MSMTLGSWMKQVYTLVPLTQCRSLLLVLKSSFQSMFQTVYHKVMLAKYCRLIWSFFLYLVIQSSGHPSSGSSTSITIKSYQETSCAVSICHLLLSSHAILSAAYSQCNVKTTPIQNVIIYTSTINQAILLSMLLLFYTQDQAILLSMRSLTIQIYTNFLSSIQIQNKSCNIHQYQ